MLTDKGFRELHDLNVPVLAWRYKLDTVFNCQS